jgi:hypothetical protein
LHHYKQIIINMSLEDDFLEKKIEELADKIQQLVERETKKQHIDATEITTRIN